MGNQITEKINQKQKRTKQSFKNKNRVIACFWASSLYPMWAYCSLILFGPANWFFFLAVSVTDELEEKIWQVRERRDELDVFVLHKYCLLSSDEVGYDPTVEVS